MNQAAHVATNPSFDAAPESGIISLRTADEIAVAIEIAREDLDLARARVAALEARYGEAMIREGRTVYRLCTKADPCQWVALSADSDRPRWIRNWHRATFFSAGAALTRILLMCPRLEAHALHGETDWLVRRMLNREHEAMGDIHSARLLACIDKLGKPRTK